jgi:hypothetical protein
MKRLLFFFLLIPIIFIVFWDHSDKQTRYPNDVSEKLIEVDKNFSETINTLTYPDSHLEKSKGIIKKLSVPSASITNIYSVKNTSWDTICQYYLEKAPTYGWIQKKSLEKNSLHFEKGAPGQGDSYTLLITQHENENMYSITILWAGNRTILNNI